MKIGDKVIYIGDLSPQLKGKTGIIKDFYAWPWEWEGEFRCLVDFSKNVDLRHCKNLSVYLKNIRLLSNQLDFSFTEDKNA